MCYICYIFFLRLPGVSVGSSLIELDNNTKATVIFTHLLRS